MAHLELASRRLKEVHYCRNKIQSLLLLFVLYGLIRNYVYIIWYNQLHLPSSTLSHKMSFNSLLCTKSVGFSNRHCLNARLAGLSSDIFPVSNVSYLDVQCLMVMFLSSVVVCLGVAKWRCCRPMWGGLVPASGMNFCVVLLAFLVSEPDLHGHCRVCCVEFVAHSCQRSTSFD